MRALTPPATKLERDELMHLHASIASQGGAKFIPTDSSGHEPAAYMLSRSAGRPLCCQARDCACSFRFRLARQARSGQLAASKFKSAHLLISLSCARPINGRASAAVLAAVLAASAHRLHPTNSSATASINLARRAAKLLTPVSGARLAPRSIGAASNWICSRRPMMNEHNFIKTNSNWSSAATRH